MASTSWHGLGFHGIDAQVTFSPHAANNARLAAIAQDIDKHTTSYLFYSLAFLYQTQGPIRDAITKVTGNNAIFVYGISDRKVGGLDVQKPDGNIAPVFPAALSDHLPEPFKSEPTARPWALPIASGRWRWIEIWLPLTQILVSPSVISVAPKKPRAMLTRRSGLARAIPSPISGCSWRASPSC